MGLEDKILSRYAAKSRDARRRNPDYLPDPLRTEFARDRDRILHSRHFRLLMHKTQVIPGPPHARFTTRLTHTLEVMQVARSLARSLRLNEDLTEAISLGHDLGHSPFGHAGEDALREIMRRAGAGGFEHNEHSLRVVDFLEALDLTRPTRQGILCHTQFDPVDYPGGRELPREFTELGYAPRGEPFTRPRTLEAQVVDLADEIAYLAHDTEDMRQAGLFDAHRGAIPERLALFLRSPKRETLGVIIKALTRHAAVELDEAGRTGALHPTIGYPEDLGGLVAEFKAFSREHFYAHPQIAGVCDEAREVLEGLFARWLEYPPTDELEGKFVDADDADRHRLLLDRVVELTDPEALHLFRELGPKE
jgi:dGTPase